MHKIGAVIQARMSSERLPGKVLTEIYGKPMLEWVLAAVYRVVPKNRVVVAISDLSSDDQLEAWCQQHDVNYFRGSLNNVALRCLNAAQSLELDYFFRVCADSPLLDSTLLKQAFDYIGTGSWDFVSNVVHRTYPRGQSVEMIKTDILKTYFGLFSTDAHFEHVTKYFYENIEQFHCLSFTSGMNAGSIQLSVDTSNDFKKAEELLTEVKGENPGWISLVSLVQQKGQT